MLHRIAAWAKATHSSTSILLLLLFLAVLFHRSSLPGGVPQPPGCPCGRSRIVSYLFAVSVYVSVLPLLSALLLLFRRISGLSFAAFGPRHFRVSFPTLCHVCKHHTPALLGRETSQLLVRWSASRPSPAPSCPLGQNDSLLDIHSAIGFLAGPLLM